MNKRKEKIMKNNNLLPLADLEQVLHPVDEFSSLTFLVYLQSAKHNLII